MESQGIVEDILFKLKAGFPSILQISMKHMKIQETPTIPTRRNIAVIGFVGRLGESPANTKQTINAISKLATFF